MGNRYRHGFLFETLCDTVRRFETFMRGKICMHRQKGGIEAFMEQKEGGGESLLEYACRQGILHTLAEEYIVFCAETSEDSAGERKREKKKKKRFPNVAGFCRYFHIGELEYGSISSRYPEEFDRLSAIFEDEALNSEVSPTVLSAYLKKRLGYEKSGGSEVCDGQLRVVFDHDIGEDGE